MTNIVNLPAFLGTDGELISAGDANWVLHPSYTGSASVFSGRVYQTNKATNSVYYRSEVPASANQTVTATIYQTTTSTTSIVCVIARCNTTANTFFLAQTYPGFVKMFKFVNGTATQIAGSYSITPLAAGETGTLELSVSGVSPSITVAAKWNGTTVLSATISESNLDAVGRVGMRFGTSAGDSSGTQGLNVSSFVAVDDAASGVTASGAMTLANAVLSSSGSVTPVASAALTTSTATFAGVSSVGVTVSGAMTTDGSVMTSGALVSPVSTTSISTVSASFSGSASVVAPSPRITTPPLKNNTGTLLASETGVVVNVYNALTGTLVLQKTGLTSDGSGVVTFVDASLSATTSYAYEVVLTGGRRRLPLVITT